MKKLPPLASLLKNPWLLTGAGILVTYALLGFFLIPFLVEHYTPSIVNEKIKRQASMGAAHFNPFLFKFEVDDFALKELDGQPILALSHLLVDFELESLFQRAWVFGDLSLEGPKVDLIVDKEGKLNLASIADSLPKSEEPPPPPSPPPRFLLKHLALKDGIVTYTRQGGTKTLSPLNLELGEVSTLPQTNGTNKLDAELDDGGMIHWKGQFSLDPIFADGEFRLEGFKLGSAWKLIHDWLNLSELSGALSLSANYHFSQQKDKTELSIKEIGFSLAKLHMALADEAQPMLDLDAIQLDKAEFDLATHNVKLPSFTIQTGQVKAAIDKQGSMNWQRIMKPEDQTPQPPIASSPPTTPEPKDEATPWKVELGAFKLANIGLAYDDTSSQVPFAATIGNVGLDLGATAEVGVGDPKVGVHGIKLILKDINIAETGPKADPNPLFKLGNIQLDGAEFDLATRSVKLPNLALQTGHIKAAVDGQGDMNWQGIMKHNVQGNQQPASPAPPTPPSDPATKDAPPPWRLELGTLKLSELGIDYTVASSQVPFAASIGDIGLDLSATAEVGAGEPNVTAHGIKLTLKDTKVTETRPNSVPEPMLSLDNFKLEGAELDLAQHSVKLPSWVIEKGMLQVSVDAEERLNWQQLSKPVKANVQVPTPIKSAAKAVVKAAEKNEAKPAPWRLELGAFKLAELGIRYADDSRKRPYLASIGGLGLNFAATAVVGEGEPKAQVNGVNLSVKDIKLNEKGKAVPLMGLDNLEVAQGRLNLDKHDVAIDKITLKGGGVQIQRNADGTISLAEAFAPKAQKNQAATEPPAAKGTTPAAPWHVALKSFGLQGFRLAYTDDTFSSPIAYDVNNIDVNVNNVNYPGKSPLSYNAKLKLKQGGSLSVTGKASSTADSADTKVVADRLNLVPLQPVVAKFAKLNLDSADFSTNLQVGFRQIDAGSSIKATGTLDVGRLLLKEAIGGQRLLSWKNLAVKGIDFGLVPDHLNIKEVHVLEPGVKVAIAKDKSNNFATALKPQRATVPTPAPAKLEEVATSDKKPKPGKTATPASKPFPVKVERVRLDDGIIDFSDLSLVIPFATRVHDFDGMATDISTAPNSRTTLKFAGRVEEFGEAKVDGTLVPSSFKTFSDVKVIFRNVEMSSLSPYSATFAGRKITSGKLSLDLLYKIENSKLKSENKILLDQFTLGEQVESPGATSLPLDLAIAILKDGDGKISATVPIEGDVDNPQFAYGSVVWDAFVTLIKTAVTAPFRAMGSLLGIEAGEDLGAIMFPPGTDKVTPPEREKIQKVAKALAQRPKVKLSLRGGFDTKLDGEALKSLRIRQAVDHKLGNDSSDGAEPLSFSDGKTQKALEDLAKERGEGFLDPVQADFEKSAGRKPSRIVGMSSLLGRASEDQAFYEKAFQQLVEAEPLPANELENLADRRMKAVLKELTDQSGFDKGRVALGKVESVSDGKDGNVPTKMELGTQE